MNDLARLASELAHALAQRRSLPELIGFVVATFRELLKAEGVAILLLDRDTDELYFPFCAEENPQVAERLAAIRFPGYRGIAGKVLRTARSLRVDDAPADPRFFAGVDQQTQRTTRSLICAPLIAPHGAVGVIEALNPRGRERFSDEDLTLLDALGQTIAHAIENVQAEVPVGAGGKPAVQQWTDNGVERLAGGGHVFRQQGEYWSIVYEGNTFRLRHAKGLVYIAHLLRNPGQPFHAIELVNAAGADSRAADRQPRESLDHRRRTLGDAGALLDRQAREDYKRRRHELQQELDEAQAFNDLGRVERAREEIEFLTHELTRALGVGGRERRAGSHAERARLNVTRAITSAVQKIAKYDSNLGRHFAATIKTGMFCSYVPDPRAPVEWVL
jgi:hypothetical protein